MAAAPARRHVAVTGARAARWGALALLVRPSYIVTEFVVAAATIGGYSFVADSVSRLGEVGCSALYCSPRHELMNGSFIGFGALLAGGAALLARPLGPWVTGLLVLAGVSSIATGFAPLDRDATLHAIAAAPLFVAQPIALITLGARLRHGRPRLARALLTTGIVTGAAAVLFVLSGDVPASGALERLALWPVLIGLAGFALDAWPSPWSIRTPRRRDGCRPEEEVRQFAQWRPAFALGRLVKTPRDRRSAPLPSAGGLTKLAKLTGHRPRRHQLFLIKWTARCRCGGTTR